VLEKIFTSTDSGTWNILYLLKAMIVAIEKTVIEVEVNGISFTESTNGKKPAWLFPVER
jgi:hypothetical protein